MLKQKWATKVKKLKIQDSFKVENTPPNRHFLPALSSLATNLDKKNTRSSVTKTLCPLGYIIKYRQQIITAIK